MWILNRARESTVYLMYRDYGKQYWKYVVSAVVLGAVGTALTQIPQIAFGLVIEVIDSSVTESQFPFADLLLSEEPEQRIIQVSIVFFLSIIFVAVSRFLSGYIWDVFKESFQKTIRVDCYESIQNLHPKRFIQRSSGEYVSVIESDVRKVGILPRTVISGVSNDLINLVTIGTVLFALNWQFSLLLLSPIPFIAWFTFKFSNAVDPLYTQFRESSAKLTGQLSSSIQGVLTVRSYVAEDREVDVVEDVSDEYKQDRLELAKTWLSYSQVFSVTSRLTSFIVLFAGSFWVINGPPLFFTESLTAGELAVFFTNSALLIQPATSVKNYVDSYKDAEASSDRVYSIIEAERRDDKEFKGSFDEVLGNIKFNDVVFDYNFSDEDPLSGTEENEDRKDDDSQDEGFVLGPMNCEIEEGQTVGVVGPSGSGKTTFIRLLMRFIDPDKGSIMVDGKNIQDSDPRSLRENIGYVEQQPYIFNSTIRNNIIYGNPEATDEDVEEAIEDSVLESSINNTEDGLETDLGESGGRMSGGEKQRIAIARAIVSDPNVLVLDEATSHVDNITESKIQRSIQEATKDRTTIAIAHRLSTVRKADKIIVFDEGKVVETGTHGELVDEEGLYHELWSKHVGLA